MWITKAALFRILTPPMKAHIEGMSSTKDLFGFRMADFICKFTVQCLDRGHQGSSVCNPHNEVEAHIE